MGLLFLNFGTGVIVARALRPAGRGELTAISLWPILLAGLATLGLPTALNFHGSRRSDDSGRLLTAAQVAAIALGLIAAGIGVQLMAVLLHAYDARIQREGQWLMVFTPQILMQYVLRANLESNGEYARSMFTQITPVVFTIIALIALAAGHHLLPFTAALSYYVPGALQTLWLAIGLRKRNRFDLSRLSSDLWILLPYGLRSYGSDVIGALSQQLDQAIVVGLLSPASLGLYVVALSLSRVINVVPSAFIAVLFPTASSLPREEAISLVGRGARLCTTASLLFGVALAGVSAVLVPFVYGDAFAPIIGIIPILTSEAVLGGLALVLGQAFLATGKPSVVTGIQAVWFAVSAALLLTLVPSLNLYGAALAITCASVVRVVLMLMSYRVVLKRPVPRIVVDGADMRFALERWRQLTLAPGTSGRRGGNGPESDAI